MTGHRYALISRRFKSAGGKGIWTLADQGIVSLGTFVVGMILARNLAPVDYGVFALILGTLYFLNNIHSSMISYPLTIKGSTATTQRLGDLTGGSMKWTLVVSTPLALGMGIVVTVISDIRHAPWAMLVVIAWQLHETARRALMTHLRHKALLPGDSVKFGGWALVTLFLTQTGQVTLGYVITSLAILSLLACAIQARQVQVRFHSSISLRSTATDAWQLGRLVLLGGILAFFTAQLPPWLLAFTHGLDSAARLQAMILILGLMHPIMFGISNILLPAVSRANATIGFEDARRTGLSYGGLGGGIILPFFLVILIFPGTVLLLFFGEDSPYLNLEQELRLLAIAYMFIYSSQVIAGMLNGVRRVPAGFLAQSAGVTAAILIGIPLIVQWGVLGACIAACTTHVIQVGIGVAYLHSSERLPWSQTIATPDDRETGSYAQIM